MATIKHIWHIDATKDKVFDALSSIDGIVNWWTKQTTGDDSVGGIIDFRFDHYGFIQVKVIECEPSTFLMWECIDAHPEWIGTIMTFQLSENEGKTRIKFEHSGWKEQSDFFGQCNFSWGRYFVSLRSYLENGVGEPYVSEQVRN